MPPSPLPTLPLLVPGEPALPAASPGAAVPPAASDGSPAPPAQAYVQRALAHAAAGNATEALAEARRALAMDHTLAVAHVVAASASVTLGDGAAAARFVRNARKLLAGAELEAPAPLAGDVTGATLLAYCARFERLLGERKDKA